MEFEFGNLIIGKRSRESKQSNVLLRRLHLPNRSCDQALNDWTAVVMKKVDLIEDDQTNQLRERSLGTLPRYDVPLFRGANNHLNRKIYTL